MTTKENKQYYPLWFFSWRPKKNDIVTPYVSFDKNDSVTPHVSFDKNDSVTPCDFFHDDQRKTTVSPPMFYLINIDSVTPYVFFPWWLMKNNRDTPYILFEKDNYYYFFYVFFHYDQ